MKLLSLSQPKRGVLRSVTALLSVAFSSSTTAIAEEETESQRIYADSFVVWIYKKPRRDPAPIGYLRGGQSVRLRSHKGAPAHQRVKHGCGKGWYAVEPAGFVCLDHRARLTETRYFRSMAKLAPQPGPHPFDYVLSMGSPSYRRVPTPREWARAERIFGEAKPRALPPHWRGHEELVTDAPPPTGTLPSFLKSRSSVSQEQEKRLVRRKVPFGSMLAVERSFEKFGRLFLQSADGTVVGANRMRFFKRSTFEGVELNAKRSLPLGWPRKKTRVYSIKNSPNCAIDGSETRTRTRLETRGPAGRLGTRPAQLRKECLVPEEYWVEQRAVVKLSGRTVDVSGTRFAELRDSTQLNRWVPTRYLYIAETKNARSSEVDPEGAANKWIHFSISQGTLVSYLGDTPLFATLASPGIGGVPAKGADPLDTRTTPVGTYRIQFKHWTDDMSPEQTEHRKYWIADVPFAMYFSQPFAIHVAYWHESFGEPMSGGCINVSPKDGERLFRFTEPRLPTNWYGVGASKEFGLGTTVVIER